MNLETNQNLPEDSDELKAQEGLITKEGFICSNCFLPKEQEAMDSILDELYSDLEE